MWASRRALLSFLTVWLALASTASGRASRQAEADSPALGRTLERTIAPGETQSTTVETGANTFIRLVVAGRGALVRVRVVSPTGEHLFDDERRGGEREPMVWAHVGERPAIHVVTVESLEADATRAYGMTLTDRAQATADDARRAEALRLLADASRRGSGTRDGASDARQAIERAIDISRQARDARIEASARAALARIDANAGRTGDASSGLQRAIDLARQAADPGMEADLLVHLGRLQAASGQPQEAERTLRAGLERHTRLGDVAGQAEALCELGGVAGSRSENDKAIELLTESALRARTSHDRRTEAAARNMLAVVSSYAGDIDGATESYQRALALRRSIDDQAGVGQTLTNLGVMLRDRGEPRAAIAYYEEALDIRRKAGAVQGTAATVHNLGVAWADLGEHDRALALFRESVDTFRASGGRRGEAFGLINIGQSYAKLGDPDQALSYVSQSLPVWREQGDRRGEALAHLSVSGIYSGRKDYDRALESLQQALRLTRAAGFTRETAQALASAASIDVARGNAPLALGPAQEAIDLARAIGDRREEGRALSALGAALAGVGRHAEGVTALNAAVAGLRSIEDRALEASARASLADALAGAGNQLTARTERLAALDLIESLRGDVSREGLRVSFFASKRPLYHKTVELLMGLHRQDSSRAFHDEAFEVSERARARALLDLLSDSGVDVKEGGDATLLTELQDVQELISVKAARLTRLLNASTPTAEAQRARREMDALLARYDDLHARMRARRPEVASLLRPEPVTVEHVRARALDSDSVLVEYWLGERESYAWAITTAGSRSVVLPGRADIEALAERASEALAEPARVVPGEAPQATAARIEASSRAFNRAATALSRMILSPFHKELSAARVLIVPDGALQYIPFAALPDPASTSAPLIERHEVTTLPSASVLVALEDRSARRAVPSPRILVLGDPVFTPDDSRVRVDATRSAGRSSSNPGTADVAPGTLARLRFSREEAMRIASLAPTFTTLALDFTATRQAAMAPGVGSYGIIHFAAHALLNDRQPQLSGIALSLVDERGRPQNGFLRLHDVYNMPLGARLVVLSACATALGKDTPGEGLIGLARGFLHAGSDRVLASLWAVDDRASAALMGRFYEALLTRDQSPGAALREAQRWMRSDSRRRHPYYWAAWVMIGTTGGHPDAH